MKASQLILYLIVGVAGFWAFKKFNILQGAPAPAESSTAKQTTGVQNIVPKSDFQTIADDITSIFIAATKSGTAQTAPKTA